MARYKKKKKTSRNKLMMIFSIMFVGIIGLTVVYAVLSTSLNISGTTNVTQSSWELSIEEYSVDDFYLENYGSDFNICSSGIINCSNNYVLTGNAKIEQLPVIDKTSIKNFSISVSIPKDSVSLLYKVINNGTIPAKLESINTYTPVYTSLNNNSSDILWAQNNFSYFFDFVTPGDFEPLVEGGILCPGETKYLGIFLEIPSDVSTLPNGPVKMSNLGVDYNFVQADMSVCS